MIRTVGLTKIYTTPFGAVSALDDVSITVKSGEFVAVVGESGSGKSTLMNVLGCLDKPDSGRYYLANRLVSGLSDRELSLLRSRHIGFVFQGFNLIPRLTAYENVELPLIYQGIPIRERRETVLSSLERVGLSARMHHRPYQLSGGQQQRVAIARAICTHAPLLLADEPTGNLDSHSGGDVLKLLQALNKSGITVLLITHDASIAGAANRVIRISDGRVASDDHRIE